MRRRRRRRREKNRNAEKEVGKQHEAVLKKSLGAMLGLCWVDVWSMWGPCGVDVGSM